MIIFFAEYSSFSSLEAPLKTSKQGVYLVILSNPEWKVGFRLHVGSSYGQQGLQHRPSPERRGNSYA